MDAKVLIFKCTRVNQPIGVRVQRMEDRDWWRTWAFKISSQIASNEGYDQNQIQGNLYATEEYPGCPHCGTDGFVQCGRCKKVSCWNQEKSLVCPWCGFHMDEIVTATDKFSVTGDSFQESMTKPMNHIKIADMTALAAYRDHLRKHPRLMYLFFELTDACNLACLHCGSSCSPEKRRFLSFDIIKKTLDRVAAVYRPQGIMICLSGGEPLLHPHFFDIAQYATSLGFSCGITTNATLINAEVAKRLALVGVQSVTVSLDGLEASHNWLRNSATAFDRTISGIRNLVIYGQGQYSVQTTTVVHNRNIDELEHLYGFVTGLKIDSWRLVNVEPIGRALENNDMLLNKNGYVRLLDFIQSRRFDAATPIDVTYGCSHYLTTPYERMVRDNYFLCGSGIYVASILANGDIYSCMDIERRPELVQGNAYTDDFVSVWENRFESFRQDRSSLCKDCADCSDRLFCNGDSGHTWNYDNNTPLLCLKKILEERT